MNNICVSSCGMKQSEDSDNNRCINFHTSCGKVTVLNSRLISPESTPQPFNSNINSGGDSQSVNPEENPNTN